MGLINWRTVKDYEFMDSPGREKLIAILLRKFMQDFRSRVDAIKDAAESSNFARISIEFESLGKSFANMGAESTAKLCFQFQFDHEAYSKEDLNKIIGRLENEKTHMKSAIEAYVSGEHL